MLEIKITLDNIDYDAAIDVLFPVISDKLEERLGEKSAIAGAVGKLIGKTQGINKTVIKGVFSRLSVEKKEELIAWCVNAKPREIGNMLTGAFKKANVSFDVKGLEMEQK